MHFGVQKGGFICGFYVRDAMRSAEQACSVLGGFEIRSL